MHIGYYNLNEELNIFLMQSVHLILFDFVTPVLVAVCNSFCSDLI